MNKKTLRFTGWTLGLSMAVAGVVTSFSGKAALPVYATDASITFENNYDTNTVLDGVEIFIDANVTCTFNKRDGGTATQYYNNGKAVRWYGGGTLQIDADGFTLSSVVITFTQTANSVSSDVGNYALSSSIGTWSGSASSVTFTQSGTTGQCRISSIEVTYSSSKNLSSIALSGTYPTTFDAGDTFSHQGMTVTANYDDESSADVTSSATFTGYNMSSAGNQTVTVSYTEGGVTKTATYGITVNAVPVISPAKSSTSGYTGKSEILSFTYADVSDLSVTSSDTSVVTVEDPSISAGSGTVKINFVGHGSTTVKFKDGSTEKASVAVSSIQTINNVNLPNTSEWSHTISAKTWEAAGAQTINGKSWTMSGTGNGYWGFDETKGQQFGSGSKPYSALQLSSSAFSGTISSVKVFTSVANDTNATVQVSVGGTAYGDAVSITNANAGYLFDLGGKSGEISINWAQTSQKAIYLKQIVVNTVSEGFTQIANNDSHKDAQSVAVTFANAFNAAMDETADGEGNKCTTGLDAAWSTCSSAYDTFMTQAAALGTTEEAYAKNLIKFATAQYSDDSGEACIERMMKTYEVCVKKHGKAAFMSELVTLGAIQIDQPTVSSIGGNPVALAVVISIIGVGAAGGYFFLRRRKEN